MFQLIKECLKEKKDYRICALEVTGKILKDLNVDYFSVLYDLLRQKRDSGVDDSSVADVDVDLHCAVIECLCNAWPASIETQKKFLLEFLNFLAQSVENTTRKNQVCHFFCIIQDKFLSCISKLRNFLFECVHMT